MGQNIQKQVKAKNVPHAPKLLGKIKSGMRVVRGPQWSWQAQDGGEGNVGTVIDVEDSKLVWVFWDYGSKANYRAGLENKYDLRIFDNGPTGVEHSNISCDECPQHPLRGFRWKCTVCEDYDLCSKCYMGDKHNMEHTFIRFNEASSKGVEVPKRQGSAKIECRGIFPGATVVRGIHWKWGFQDGLPFNDGKVLSVDDWGSDSGNSAVKVEWDGGSTNNYRVGHDGKVDLKCTQTAVGGFYYKDHLPCVGQYDEQRPVCSDSDQLKLGDKVRVGVDEQTLKVMQEGHGGFNHEMTDSLGKTGLVVAIIPGGNIKVKFDNASQAWNFNKDVLVKMNTFSVNDTVKILSNKRQVKKLQEGHGGWADHMAKMLGKNGKVKKTDDDGDVHVVIDGQGACFNHECCTLVERGEGGIPDDESESGSDLFASLLLAHLLGKLSEESEGSDNLVRVSAQGKLDEVQRLLREDKTKVNEKDNEHTALQVASHEGHAEIVEELLSAGADLEIPDDDGDTALLCAIIGNKPDIAERLLQQGAEVDVLNNKGHTPLMVATRKRLVECAKLLLKHKASTTIQDSFGDTAVHDAIALDEHDILQLLLDAPDVDISIRNKKSCTPLHHAVLKNNNLAVKKILQKNPQCVDDRLADGGTSLVLAVGNGLTEVATTLIDTGKANVEALSGQMNTPLHLAAHRGHLPVVTMLVSKGANVNTTDKDGDSALHLAFIAMKAAFIEERKEDLVEIACCLVRHGANLEQKNLKGQTPMELLTDPAVARKVREAAEIGASGLTVSVPECLICNDKEAEVEIKPCGHMVFCRECHSSNVVRMRRCPVCRNPIQKRVPSARIKRDSTIRRLERQVHEMQNIVTCSICMDNKKTIAFDCGHGACQACASRIQECHVCRKNIQTRLELF